MIVVHNINYKSCETQIDDKLSINFLMMLYI